ncbi:type IV pilus assembly protein PilF [Fontimonas thermophila]|uniref:Type IV pilus assembly protein PilF n=1 Tax=Fontimonas thermophila TaxID=1076937 RepID=A0A1I2JIA4_9GAMM|nr:type IV pilus biogenesis/stability protein PilW [Fontimonas thermophila]SFF54595.1 type IV pilus assembly protein PilF [Fontimonas thermophila]
MIRRLMRALVASSPRGAVVVLRAVWIAGLLVLAACSGAGVRNDKDAARINTQLGINYAQRGQYAAALEKLKRALAQDDALPGAHAAIAFVYQNMNESAKAERHYRRALELQPDDPALKNNFGVFLCSRKRSEEAERLFLEAARDPRYGTPEAAWTNAGICLKTQDPGKAERYFREALQIKPDYREALAQMAGIAFRQQDYLRTRAFLQRYDLNKSATAELLYMAVRTEAALGDLSAAKAFARRLKLEFPESEEAASTFLNLE